MPKITPTPATDIKNFRSEVDAAVKAFFAHATARTDTQDETEAASYLVNILTKEENTPSWIFLEIIDTLPKLPSPPQGKDPKGYLSHQLRMIVIRYEGIFKETLFSVSENAKIELDKLTDTGIEILAHQESLTTEIKQFIENLKLGAQAQKVLTEKLGQKYIESQTRVHELRESKDSLTIKLFKAEEQVHALTETNAVLGAALTDKEKALSDLQRDATEQQTVITHLSEENQQLKDQLAAMQQQHSSLIVNFNRKSKDLETSQENNRELTHKVGELKATLATAKQLVADMEQQIESLNSQAKAAESQLRQVTKENTTLKATIQEMKAATMLVAKAAGEQVTGVESRQTERLSNLIQTQGGPLVSAPGSATVAMATKTTTATLAVQAQNLPTEPEPAPAPHH